MYLAYSFVLTLGLLILLPRFLFDIFRHGKYIEGLRQRLGQLPTLEASGHSIIWIHCVSVGETQAARPLVKALCERLPSHMLAISTTTRTGQQLAKNLFKDQAAAVFYFPLDWRWTVRRALRTINPAVVLIMETELWPNFLRECRRQKIPVAIVNGRLSANSFRRYRMVKSFIGHVLSNIELAAMQTEEDAQRVLMLGMERDRVTVSGNLKFDAGTLPLSEDIPNRIRERFGLTSANPLILAASTHEPEEQIILEAYKRLKYANEQARLMLAPRHPERFQQVASLLERSGLPWARQSANHFESDEKADVILLDTIGELSSVYSLAAIVFVGGSIAKVGGHNILEPAASGSCILTGPHTHNFEEIIRTFVEAQAVIQLSSVTAAVDQFEVVLTTLLRDSSKRQEMGQRAKMTLEQNLGATERTLRKLAPILDHSQTGDCRGDSVVVESASVT